MADRPVECAPSHAVESERVVPVGLLLTVRSQRGRHHRAGVQVHLERRSLRGASTGESRGQHAVGLPRLQPAHQCRRQLHCALAIPGLHSRDPLRPRAERLPRARVAAAPYEHRAAIEFDGFALSLHPLPQSVGERRISGSQSQHESLRVSFLHPQRAQEEGSSFQRVEGRLHRQPVAELRLHETIEPAPQWSQDGVRGQLAPVGVLGVLPQRCEVFNGEYEDRVAGQRRDQARVLPSRRRWPSRSDESERGEEYGCEHGRPPSCSFGAQRSTARAKLRPPRESRGLAAESAKGERRNQVELPRTEHALTSPPLTRVALRGVLHLRDRQRSPRGAVGELRSEEPGPIDLLVPQRGARRGQDTGLSVDRIQDVAVSVQVRALAAFVGEHEELVAVGLSQVPHVDRSRGLAPRGGFDDPESAVAIVVRRGNDQVVRGPPHRNAKPSSLVFRLVAIFASKT